MARDIKLYENVAALGVNVNSIKSDVAYIKVNLDLTKEHLSLLNEKVDIVKVGQLNHLKHHEQLSSNLKWFIGTAITIAGVVSAIISLIFK